jgi:hypothetical protein
MSKLGFELVRYRVQLLQKLNFLFLGRLSGNVPGTVINSIEENLHCKTIRQHVNEIITIAEPDVAKYPFSSDFPYFFRRSKAFDKKNLYVLNNVFVSPFSGLSWIKNNYFLVESVGSLYRMIGWNNVLHEPLLKWEKLNEQNHVVSCPNQSFYHWLFESLPGILMAIETFPDSKIMISDKCPAYCKEMLSLIIGEQEFEHKVIVAGSVKLVPNFITLQQEPDAGFVHPVVIEYLRRIRDKCITQTTHHAVGSFIYISRRKAFNRILTGEEEVEEALQLLGFDIVFCEDLSIKEQMVVFSNATCIIAPHGAGLSNIVWAKQDVTIHEIFPYAYFNDCFARLAISLGFNYSYSYAEESKGNYGKINVNAVIESAIEMLKIKERVEAV